MHSRIACFTILFALSFTACAPENEQSRSSSANIPANGIEISNAWARPANQNMTGGAYFTIANGSDRADTLVSVSTEAAEMVEIHESYEENGISGMRPAGPLTIESGSTLELIPGGYHLMLMQVNRNLAVGDSIRAALFFSRSDSIVIHIPVSQNE